MTLRPLIFWIPCAGALAAGWFAGVSGSGTPRSTTSGAVAPSQPPPLIHAGGHGLALNPGSAAGQWVARVRRDTGAEFASLWREIEHVWPDDRTTIDLHAARLAARKILLASWMSQDWMAACAFVAQEADPDQLDAVASGAAEILVALQPSVASEILRGSRELALSAHPAFRDTLWRKLAAADPQGFLALMPGDPADLKTWSSHFLPAMATWAKNDPVAVAAYWEAQAGSLLRSFTSKAEILPKLVTAWFQRDPAAVKSWIDRLEDESSKSTALKTYYDTLASSDPRAVMECLFDFETLERLRQGNRKADPRLNALTVIAETDPVEAWRLARHHLQNGPQESDLPYYNSIDRHRPPPISQRMRNAIASGIWKAMPEHPADFAKAMATFDFGRLEMDGDTASDWQSRVAASWLAEKSTSERWLFMETARDLGADAVTASALRPALSAVLQSLFKDSPHQALDFYKTLAPAARDLDSAALLSEISSVASPDRPALIRDLLETLQPASLPQGFLPQAIANQPQAVATIIARQEPGQDRHGAMIELARYWGRDDPQAAAGWLMSQPETDQDIASGMTTLASTWTGYDDESASAWVAGLPQGVFRDQAILGLAGGLLSSDMEAAWIWALTIRPGPARTSGLSMVTQRWMLDDPEAARAAVDQSPLSAAEKEEIQRPGNLRKFESGGRAYYFNMSPKAP